VSRQCPQDYHPDLSIERLVVAAQLIARGRANAVEHHLPDIGDDAWILGVRGFSASKRELSAHDDEFPWLSIDDPSLHFVFKIGGATLRFYAGAPDKPNARFLKKTLSEIKQSSFNFEYEGSENLIFRIAVETDIDGQADNIYLVCCRDDVVIDHFLIPYREKTALMPIEFSVVEKSSGVELPPAHVELPPSKKREAEAS